MWSRSCCSRRSKTTRRSPTSAPTTSPSEGAYWHNTCEFALDLVQSRCGHDDDVRRAVHVLAGTRDCSLQTTPVDVPSEALQEGTTVYELKRNGGRASVQQREHHLNADGCGPGMHRIIMGDVRTCACAPGYYALDGGECTVMSV